MTGQHWYNAAWTFPVTWVLIFYCFVCSITLYGLCTRGCLRGIELNFSSAARQARRRERQERREMAEQRQQEIEREEQMWADFYRERIASRQNVEPSLLRNVPPAPDFREAEDQDEQLRYYQRERAVISREIELATAAGQEVTSMDGANWIQQPKFSANFTGVGSIRQIHNAQHNIDADLTSTDYDADVEDDDTDQEAHREYRSARKRSIELRRSVSPDQRLRLERHAEVKANLRATGLL